MIDLSPEAAALVTTLSELRPTPALLFCAAVSLTPDDWRRAAVFSGHRPPSEATKAEVIRVLAAQAILYHAKISLKVGDAGSISAALSRGLRSLISLSGGQERPAIESAFDDLVDHLEQKTRRAA